MGVSLVLVLAGYLNAIIIIIVLVGSRFDDFLSCLSSLVSSLPREWQLTQHESIDFWSDVFQLNSLSSLYIYTHLWLSFYADLHYLWLFLPWLYSSSSESQCLTRRVTLSFCFVMEPRSIPRIVVVVASSFLFLGLLAIFFAGMIVCGLFVCRIFLSMFFFSLITIPMIFHCRHGRW